jgi:hypothetical protein
MSKKPFKTRAKNYDPKLKIHGSFEDVIKVMVTNPDKPKEKAVKQTKKPKSPEEIKEDIETSWGAELGGEG